jgi:hypothetical protein
MVRDDEPEGVAKADDPHHEYALMHLALLMEKLDRKTEAHLLLTRAGRLV